MVTRSQPRRRTQYLAMARARADTTPVTNIALPQLTQRKRLFRVPDRVRQAGMRAVVTVAQ